MELTDADRVWNRACAVELGARGPGDWHLWALLRVHNSVMAGGTGFAAEIWSSGDVARAAEAAGYFGLASLADLLARLTEVEDPDMAEETYGDLYPTVVPADSLLDEAFKRRFAAAPQDFEPLS